MPLVCGECNENGRVSKPVLVHYICIRENKRKAYLACSRCDAIDNWPNFDRVSPSAETE